MKKFLLILLLAALFVAAVSAFNVRDSLKEKRQEHGKQSYVDVIRLQNFLADEPEVAAVSNDDNSSSNDDDNTDEEKGDVFKRKVEVKNEGNKVRVESQMKQGKSKDMLKVDIEAKEDVRITYQYSSKSEEINNKNWFRARFMKLIEYKDAVNGAAGYEQGEEQREINLSDINWNDWSCPQTSNPDGSSAWTCTVNSTDGTISFYVTFADHIVNNTNSALRPTTFKIGAAVTNHQFTGQENKLAMVTRVFSKERTETRDESEEEEEGLAKLKEKQVSFGDSAFFSWVATATENGTVSVPVINSALANATASTTDDESANEYVIIFSFDIAAPRNLEWDPKIGASANALALYSSASSVVVNFSAVLVALMSVLVATLL
eukprot:GEZU01026690.1.p1 GENE.GEZU01026690.1~~GEZU01026690.1.p1  ORF type:complete len:377 (-),score=163.60 GEZU01026690.1:135-1265(-)